MSGQVTRSVKIIPPSIALFDDFSVDLPRGQVELSLRSTKFKGTRQDTTKFAILKTGQILEGRVKKVKDYGIFIELIGINVSGLCHKSEVCLAPS